MSSRYDELGLKVLRAQQALESIRGTGTVDGVTVEVDAENQVVAVSGPQGEAILAAYQLAVRQMQPRVTAAMHELTADPLVESTMAFTSADTVVFTPAPAEPTDPEDDPSIFEHGW
ncbi:hypothetical protein [Nocardia sp. A7]|uniref:hypothetical protein n=1 Tax=Nocardia sp. A7 TaxID=2789274 RepID=UPI00397AA107